MDIAIFSDIHGNLEALKVILEDIKKKNITNIICLGDVIGLGPNPKECIELVMNNNIEMVLGNHELYYLRGTIIDDEMSDAEIKHHEWIKEQLNDEIKYYLEKCNMIITKEINNDIFSFQHFLLNPDINDIYPFDDLKIINNGTIENIIKNNKSKIIFIGHEHKSFSIKNDNNMLIDIGSSGCTKDENTFYTILHIESDINIEKVYLKYNRKLFENKIKNIDYPNIFWNKLGVII